MAEGMPWVPLLALAVTLAAVPAATAALEQRGVLDRPGHRSSHVHPTVRGGGVAPALTVVVLGAAAAPLLAPAGDARALWVGVLVAGGAFAALGLVEDLVGVAPLRRLGAQVGIALVSSLWLAGPLAQAAGAEASLAAGAVAAVAVTGWVTAYANVFNFMDGINGISAVSVVVTGGTWYLLGLATGADVLSTGGILVALAALGFLPYNFPRARVFLGDVGSYFFGALLGALVVVGLVEGVPVEGLLAPLLLPLADTGSTLLGRLRRRETWYAAHCDHVYQRLVRGGWSHGRTTLSFGALLVAASLLGAVAATADRAARVAADVLLLALVVGYLQGPRLARARVAVAA